MMKKQFEFEAEIIPLEGKDAAFIEFPYNVQETCGVKGQVKVKAWFDGHLYRGSLARMGRQCHVIGLTKAVRNAIGKQAGELVHVIIEKDEEARIVEIPPDLAEALNKYPSLRDVFDKLSYTLRKEFVLSVSEAKKEETRQRRIVKVMERLREKAEKQ